METPTERRPVSEENRGRNEVSNGGANKTMMNVGKRRRTKRKKMANKQRNER